MSSRACGVLRRWRWRRNRRCFLLWRDDRDYCIVLLRPLGWHRSGCVATREPAASGSDAVIADACLAAFVQPHDASLRPGIITQGVQGMMNLMLRGVLVGMRAVGLIDRVPREFAIGIVVRDQEARRRTRTARRG